MKIIDTHTHFPGNTFSLIPRTAKEMRREFEKEGLSGAWIFTTDGLISDEEKNNNLLADGVKGERDFFSPSCTVSPHKGESRAIRELLRCKNGLNMKGVKLHQWLQAFSVTHPVLLPVIRKAGELKMPVVFHDGTPPYATPLQIAWLAEQSPETKIILGHTGLDDLWQDAVIACKNYKNIYLCLCSLSSGNAREVLKACPAERLLYGSDGGFFPGVIEDAILKVKATGAEKKALSRIFNKNPQRLVRQGS